MLKIFNLVSILSFNLIIFILHLLTRNPYFRSKAFKFHFIIHGESTVIAVITTVLASSIYNLSKCHIDAAQSEQAEVNGKYNFLLIFNMVYCFYSLYLLQEFFVLFCILNYLNGLQ